jgi:hypothetical protein
MTKEASRLPGRWAGRAYRPHGCRRDIVELEGRGLKPRPRNR